MKLIFDNGYFINSHFYRFTPTDIVELQMNFYKFVELQILLSVDYQKKMGMDWIGDQNSPRVFALTKISIRLGRTNLYNYLHWDHLSILSLSWFDSLYGLWLRTITILFFSLKDHKLLYAHIQNAVHRKTWSSLGFWLRNPVAKRCFRHIMIK